jgi:hypothetical protein
MDAASCVPGQHVYTARISARGEDYAVLVEELTVHVVGRCGDAVFVLKPGDMREFRQLATELWPTKQDAVRALDEHLLATMHMLVAQRAVTQAALAALASCPEHA